MVATSEHGPSIKNPKVYEALRRKGYSKTKAAKISNAQKQLHSRAKAGVRKAGNWGSRKGAHGRKR